MRSGVETESLDGSMNRGIRASLGLERATPKMSQEINTHCSFTIMFKKHENSWRRLIALVRAP